MPFESAHRQRSNIGDSVSFVMALTATRSNLEHATCALRAHHIRKPPPHLINGIRLVFRVLTRSFNISISDWCAKVYCVLWCRESPFKN